MIVPARASWAVEGRILFPFQERTFVAGSRYQPGGSERPNAAQSWRKPVDIMARMCAIIREERSVHTSRVLARARGVAGIGGRRTPRHLAVGIFLRELTMPKAIELIVDVYVRYQNRRALGDLMVHRQRLVTMLRGRPNIANFDFGKVLGQLDHEIAVIQKGIEAVVSLGERERLAA